MGKEISFSPIASLITSSLNRLDLAAALPVTLRLFSFLNETDDFNTNRGRHDIWAGVIILTIVKINMMDLILLEEPFDMDELCDILKVKKGTVSAKANQVEEHLKSNDIATDFMDENLFSEELVDLFESLNDPWNGESEENEDFQWEIQFFLPNNRARAKIFQLEAYLNQYCNKPGSRITLESCETIDLQTVELSLVSSEMELDSFIDTVKNETKADFSILDQEYIDEYLLGENTNSYVPSGYYKSTMRDGLAIGSILKDVQSIEDAELKLKKVIGKNPDDLMRENPPSKVTENIISALAAYDLDKETSLEVLDQILMEDQYCIEAMICKAGWIDDAEIRINMLEQALDNGDELLGVNQDFEVGRWWYDHMTRPYLRALYLLGIELIHNGYYQEGIETLEEVLSLNPSDNQGVRLDLLIYYLQKRKLEKCRILFQKFPDEGSALFAYGYCFMLFMSLGNKSKSKKAAISAYERNPYPLHYIVGDLEPDFSTEYFKFGSPEEALEVLPLIYSVTDQNSKILDWTIEAVIKGGDWQTKE